MKALGPCGAWTGTCAESLRQGISGAAIDDGLLPALLWLLLCFICERTDLTLLMRRLKEPFRVTPLRTSGFWRQSRQPREEFV